MRQLHRLNAFCKSRGVGTELATDWFCAFTTESFFEVSPDVILVFLSLFYSIDYPSVII